MQDKVGGGKQEKEKAAKRFSEISAGVLGVQINLYAVLTQMPPRCLAHHLHQFH